MRYDREIRYVRRGYEPGGGEWLGRGEYGATYEAPYRAGYHGFGMGYRGGALRSRGSYEAGQLRSGLNPVDEFEFEWGGGYVGGRGYGGTNYDYEHGYQPGVSAQRIPAVGGVPPHPRRPPSPATRGGYAWAEYDRIYGEPHGPARYGYGPYHERLLRRRRSDDELRADVEETLFYDTWVDADRIVVAVEDGIVTLTGTLPSYDEVRYATDDAWDVDGVRGVRTELAVEQPAAPAGGARPETEAPGARSRGPGARRRGAAPEAPAATTPPTRAVAPGPKPRTKQVKAATRSEARPQPEAEPRPEGVRAEGAAAPAPRAGPEPDDAARDGSDRGGTGRGAERGTQGSATAGSD